MSTMHELVKKAIKSGKSNTDALEFAKREHPYSKMTLATVNYLRNQMRKTDRTIKPARR